MAEETLVKETLTQDMIQVGEKVTHRLEHSQLPVSASLWLYLPEANRWRLIIASPLLSKSGPKRLYEKIQSVLLEAADGLGGIELSDISVMEPQAAMLSAMSRFIKIGEERGVRISKNVFNGQFIEDAYVYRLGKN